MEQEILNFYNEIHELDIARRNLGSSLEKYHISFEQYMILIIISTTGINTPTSINKKFFKASLPAMSRKINQLIRLGYLKRNFNDIDEDQRVVHLNLTDMAQDLLINAKLNSKNYMILTNDEISCIHKVIELFNRIEL